MRNGTFPRADVSYPEAREEMKNKLFLLGFTLTEGQGKDTHGIMNHWTVCWHSERLYTVLYSETISIYFKDEDDVQPTLNYGLEYMDQIFVELTKMLEILDYDNK